MSTSFKLCRINNNFKIIIKNEVFFNDPSHSKHDDFM